MSVGNFFKDENGKVVVAQSPNLLIVVWGVLQLAILLLANDPVWLRTLATAVLFTWAYLELRQGDSPFRKVLGAVVLIIIVVGLSIG